MKDAAVWSHQHRMYLIGSNSISFPWFIPKDFPKDALSRKDRESFIKFIDSVNPKLKYTACQRFTFYLLSVLMPPAADAYHLSVRKAKFAMLQEAILKVFLPQFWADNGDNKTLRLNCSPRDY